MVSEYKIVGDIMKLGDMQIDYEVGTNYNFLEKRKQIKEGKRLLQLHPKYEILKKDRDVKTESDYYFDVLIAYLKDCILEKDPEANKLYNEIYQKHLDMWDGCGGEEMISPLELNSAFLKLYNNLLRERENPGILEKERQERIAKQEQLQIQSKIRDRLAQQELQQDLANGTRVLCPYCKSADTKKLTALNRAVSVSLVGAASGKIGKQWHCNHCGSDF